MNETWRQVETDAHIAKADALDHAIAVLGGLDGMVEPVLQLLIVQTCMALHHEQQRHEQAAKLAAV